MMHKVWCLYERNSTYSTQIVDPKAAQLTSFHEEFIDIILAIHK